MAVAGPDKEWGVLQLEGAKLSYTPLPQTDTIPHMSSSLPEACVPNISLGERRKRLLSGLIMFAIGLGALAGLLAIGINPLWRLALFPVFFGAGAGFFQWRDKT